MSYFLRKPRFCASDTDSPSIFAERETVTEYNPRLLNLLKRLLLGFVGGLLGGLVGSLIGARRCGGEGRGPSAAESGGPETGASQSPCLRVAAGRTLPDLRQENCRRSGRTPLREMLHDFLTLKQARAQADASVP